MVQLTNLRFALVTILALGGAFFSNTKNGVKPVDKKTQIANSPESVPAGLSTNDWASIGAAYEAGRHKAFAVDGGYHARNPGQKFTTSFDGRGFLVTPDQGNWTWGLELNSYGVPGNERTVSGNANVKASGQAVDYNWDSNLTEWYKNDKRGLEHGFTINSRHPQSNGKLTLNLTVRGNLNAKIQNPGRDISFVNSSNASVLNYSGLTVIDARGKILAAHFESTKNGLKLSAVDEGAQYPITIDPVVQQTYLKASNTDVDDFFGQSVAVAGDTVVVGARLEDSASTGVNGDQGNNSATDSGAAYVFVRSGTTWTQQAYLKASNTQATDVFGRSVAISGDTVVVGAFGEDSAATGVNGDQGSNSATDSGAVYVFVRSGTTWTQQAYLKASNADADDLFGWSVAVSGDTVVVGGYFEDSASTGVNGNQADNSANESGAAYIFVRSGSTWSQQAYLKASNTGADDLFGYSVSVSGDTVVVGARVEDSATFGVNGDQSNNAATDSGAVYVFIRNGTTWSQQAYLKASNTGTGDFFGNSVSVSNDTVVVGADFEDSATTGVDGDQTSNAATDSGAAYVYIRNVATWTQQAYLKASNTRSGDRFGVSVAVSGDTVVVGGFGEDGAATGVDGDQTSIAATDSGAAYVFIRNGTTWTQQAYLKASNTGAFDNFGISVAVSGDSVVVGAFFEDSATTGVDGDQSSNDALESGAAYVFNLDNNPGVLSYGIGTSGCAGAHTLGVTQAPIVNSPHFSITCNNSPPFQNLLIGVGFVTDVADVPGTTNAFGLGFTLHVDLVASTELLTFDVYGETDGVAVTRAPIPNNPILIGRTFYAQEVFLWLLQQFPNCSLAPVGGPPTYALSSSNGLAITILAP